MAQSSRDEPYVKFNDAPKADSKKTEVTQDAQQHGVSIAEIFKPDKRKKKKKKGHDNQDPDKIAINIFQDNKKKKEELTSPTKVVKKNDLRIPLWQKIIEILEHPVWLKVAFLSDKPTGVKGLAHIIDPHKNCIQFPSLNGDALTDDLFNNTAQSFRSTAECRKSKRDQFRDPITLELYQLLSTLDYSGNPPDDSVLRQQSFLATSSTKANLTPLQMLNNFNTKLDARMKLENTKRSCCLPCF